MATLVARPMSLSLDATFDNDDESLSPFLHDASEKMMVRKFDGSSPCVRRHSIGQTSHKMLRHDEPEYFEKLKLVHAMHQTTDKNHGADLEESSLDSALDDTLANQTLDELFHDNVEEAPRKRYSLGSTGTQAHLQYDLHATHQLDLHKLLFQQRQQKSAKFSEQAPASAKSTLSSAGSWLKLLAKRGRSNSRVIDEASDATRPRSNSSVDRPPLGWTPTLPVVTAVMKLRKLRAQRAAARAAEKAAAAKAALELAGSRASPDARRSADEAEEAAEEATNASYACDPQQFRDVDVQSFIEECWIAQAASDPSRAGTFDGMYDSPPMMSPMPSFATSQQSFGCYQAQLSPPMSPMMMSQPSFGYPGAPMGPPPMMALAPPMMAQVSSGHMPPMMAQMSSGHIPAACAAAVVGSDRKTMPVRESYEAGAVNHALGRAGGMPVPLASVPWIGTQSSSFQASWSAPESPRTNVLEPRASAAVRPASVSLVAMAQERDGSIALQQRLLRMGEAELRLAIDELAPHLSSLATHAFGNYLVSSMASIPTAHGALYAAMHGRVTSLMQHPQGSRVVQAVIQALPATQAHSLVEELAGRVAEVSAGTHGSWSVVAAYKASHAPFIVSELAKQMTPLSVQQNGSRVVQRVMTEATAAGADVSEMVHALVAHAPDDLARLATDRFANYVVQLALRSADTHTRAQLIDKLLPSVFTAGISQSKCGSNVAEMLVELASASQLVAAREGLTEEMAMVLRAHAYGKYVMTALDRRA